MKLNSRAFLPLLAIAAGLTFGAVRAAAQAQPLSTLPPVIVKKEKPLKFDGQVIAANVATITVRSQENPMLTQTFSYSPEVRDQIIKILNKGGYQFGDKVQIHYMPGTTTAIKLKGNPSKPRVFAPPKSSSK